MSGKLRNLKKRIRSVESTKKITRAMEMIATAKFHRYQNIILKSRVYVSGLETLLKRLSRDKKQETSHPFLTEIDEEKRVGLVLITSDTGLCGSFNHELIQSAQNILSQKPLHPYLIGIGRRGINSFTKAGHLFQKTYSDIRTGQIDQVIEKLGNSIQEAFIENSLDAIYVVYGRCLTLSSYEITCEQLLPFEKARLSTFDLSFEYRYIYEPSPEIVFQKLIPLYFDAKVRQIFLEAFMSEQIARMKAMHQATENASEMIDTLVLQRNKARQAAITGEIIEVVSGSRALKK